MSKDKNFFHWQVYKSYSNQLILNISLNLNL